MKPPREYRIDELARVAGTTVRNARVYQDRGLLPAPRRKGRTAIYSESHVARLKLVGQLLRRGYTLQNIAELLGAFEKGYDLADLIGLGISIASPFSDEQPSTLSAAELAALFDRIPEPSVLQGAIELGLFEPDGEGFRVPSRRLLEAGAELARAGVPFEVLLEQIRAIRADADRIAARLVQLVLTHVFDPHGEGLPPASLVPELAQVVQRLRPLARTVMETELARALERHARTKLGERLVRVWPAMSGADAPMTALEDGAAIAPAGRRSKLTRPRRAVSPAPATPASGRRKS